MNNNIKIYLSLLILFVIINSYIKLYNNTIYKNTKYNKYQKHIVESNIKPEILFYKCDKFVINKILKNILKNNKINRTYQYNDNWLLFMPCTYNNIEKELNKVKNLKNKLLFGVRGCDLIVSKNNIWKLLEIKYGRNNAINIMPETYILSDKNHMQLFKKDYSSEQIYIMKKNIQRKQGLLLTNDYDLITNNNDDKFRIVQKYIKNTFMINKRKLNLRIYLLIVIKNNKLKSYYYKNGKCIYTNKDYNNSLELEENITSLNMDVKIYKKNPFDLFELCKYLGDEKYLILLNNLKNNLKSLENCYKNILLKLNINNNKNTYFQLFGLDYIFSNNLDVYLLELNKGPDMSSKNNKDFILKSRVYEDLFKLVKIIKNKSSTNMFEKI
tara:strand:- start:952 stop:2103 length:1152 start_codon:yes stop_codon:yes gene_type:complete